MTETKIGAVGDLALRLGGVLRDVELAYVTYGRLAADGRNAVLLTHGYTSSHLFADGGTGASEGSWADLLGPGRAIDTERYYVVSSNMLGSAFGSTAPRTRNPRTGRAYGPDFPPLTLSDIVVAQRRLLDRLGVRALAAVVGPSFGGFQAFAWGVEFPDYMRGLVPVVTAPKPPDEADTATLARRLAADLHWNDGHYYEAGGIGATMRALREETLRRYGIEEQLAPRLSDLAARDAEIVRLAASWADAFDGHSLLTLGYAMNRFDATPDLGRIRCPVLYVLSRTDKLFPPSLAPGVMAALEAAGVKAAYHEIDSAHGHLASGTDAAKWAPVLARFMASLAP